jgi:hypothetical protein
LTVQWRGAVIAGRKTTAGSLIESEGIAGPAPGATLPAPEQAASATINAALDNFVRCIEAPLSRIRSFYDYTLMMIKTA